MKKTIYIVRYVLAKEYEEVGLEAVRLKVALSKKEAEDFIESLEKEEEELFYKEEISYNIEEVELPEEEEIFAEKRWRKEDVASIIIGSGYEATEENIAKVIKTMQEKGYISVLLDCTDAEWRAITDAVKECNFEKSEEVYFWLPEDLAEENECGADWAWSGPHKSMEEVIIDANKYFSKNGNINKPSSYSPNIKVQTRIGESVTETITVENFYRNSL